MLFLSVTVFSDFLTPSLLLSLGAIPCPFNREIESALFGSIVVPRGNTFSQPGRRFLPRGTPSLANNLCLYCREAGNLVPSGCRFILQALLPQVSVLIDSGAEVDVMDIKLAACLGVPPIPLAEPISAGTLCCTHLNTITHSTIMQKRLAFSSHSLLKHNPHID